MTTWQVRDEGRGLCLEDAELGYMAIAALLRRTETADVAHALTGVSVDPVTGIVSATYKDTRYHAVPRKEAS